MHEGALIPAAGGQARLLASQDREATRAELHEQANSAPPEVGEGVVPPKKSLSPPPLCSTTTRSHRPRRDAGGPAHAAASPPRAAAPSGKRGTSAPALHNHPARGAWPSPRWRQSARWIKRRPSSQICPAAPMAALGAMLPSGPAPAWRRSPLTPLSRAVRRNSCPLGPSCGRRAQGRRRQEALPGTREPDVDWVCSAVY